MKNMLNKFKDGIFIGAGIICVLGIANSWEDIGTVTNGDSLTETVWNNLVTKVNETGNRVSGIFTDGDGNVGVGTVSPTAKLSVGGGIDIGATSNVLQGADISMDAQGLISTESNFYLNADSTGDGTGGFIFGKGTNTSTATRLMTIENGGNVGIGTSTPSSLLDVNGTADLNEITGPWDNSDNGYIRLGDIQIAWGKKIASSWPATVTYPIAFSEAPVVTATNPRSGYYTTIGTSNIGPTPTSFTCYIVSNVGANATSTTDCNWIAIGKWR